ncbi:hypothetical protein [Oceanobacillus jeddahense]|uniref:hypothetical protein n=1 Tax=Oceanobacillus jeddahense TaxID=1462527 RepID=UPI000AD7AEC7|nr:hypothetical protein [Oceanobacillus jeddahense]
MINPLSLSKIEQTYCGFIKVNNRVKKSVLLPVDFQFRYTILELMRTDDKE